MGPVLLRVLVESYDFGIDIAESQITQKVGDGNLVVDLSFLLVDDAEKGL